jgi:hypothetical protein
MQASSLLCAVGAVHSQNFGFDTTTSLCGDAVSSLLGNKLGEDMAPLVGNKVGAIKSLPSRPSSWWATEPGDDAAPLQWTIKLAVTCGHHRRFPLPTFAQRPSPTIIWDLVG